MYPSLYYDTNTTLPSVSALSPKDHDPHTLTGSPSSLAIFGDLAITALKAMLIPKPTQEGERITEEWLLGLDDVNCLYQFCHSRFSAVEALGLLLAQFSTVGDLYDLVAKYDWSICAISEVINELVCFLDKQWSHLLEPGERKILVSQECLTEYTAAIHNAGAPLSTVWGFLDCTICFITRPTWYQWQAYNGYKGHHALKYQAIKLPNGLTGFFHGPFEGRRNDNHLLGEPHVLEWCREHVYCPGADAGTPIEQ
ncbi:hypothetical protein D9758_009816 [Tetrapyrgos nigripes]|uniref:DDE Tnp4 domain-containing protein n=1 Tax=Tetrapyrgos nigripes TaxID=182062 RepID=A0A8H5LSG2_9AGAR|nr:hypothetical protein D9758_009816 [Tetrapyrgos nigripes]